jgi:hypothetical protein
VARAELHFAAAGTILRPGIHGGRIVELAQEVEIEAEYTLESPVRCPNCKKSQNGIQVVRLLRTKVNFTSSLPRRGYALTCPDCKTLLSAGLSGLLG